MPVIGKTGTLGKLVFNFFSLVPQPRVSHGWAFQLLPTIVNGFIFSFTVLIKIGNFINKLSLSRDMNG